MKIFPSLSLIIIFFTISTFAQQTELKRFHPFSGKVAMNLEGGGTYAQTDFSDDQISYIGQVSLDYFFPTTTIGAWGLRGYGYYGELKGSGDYYNKSTWPTIPAYYTEIAALGGGVSYTLIASDFFFPYAFAGADYLYYDPKDVDGIKLQRNKENRYGNITWSLVGEIGSRFLITNLISFNIALNYHYLPTDNIDDIDDAISNGTQNDVFFTGRAGFSFYFGGTSDMDNDGVKDADDICPDTPPFVQVDEFGCPIDTDKDGVPDYMDKCTETPRNVVVNQNGCPLDVDGDDVPDYLDLCPDTPSGVKVDSRGCPLDVDEDGVPDFKDLCPNTPVGTEVNKWGCPIDEPETVVEPKMEKTEFILSGGVTFESNKADLLSPAYIDLDKVIKVMKDHPETKWNIEGHTDNTGSYNRNKELSLMRAQSVYNYFIKNGIAPARLIVNGYGPDYPIADNNTETGRTMNRRVAIILLSSDVIDKSVDKKDLSENNMSKVYNSAAERSAGNNIFTDGSLYCF
jgi:OmpA-OmpF porin, OOP family